MDSMMGQLRSFPYYVICVASHLSPQMRMRYISLLALLLACACCAQVAERSVRPARTVHQPSLDGSADDVWLSTPEISAFRQREPFEGTPATEKTSVRVLYDKRSLYFLIECHDRQPQRIVATELRRDADLSVDDSFTIL